jgi:heptosyltransferase-1
VQRVLIIKTSSLGDVIHTLPALTDASKLFPDIRFDWVIEESFAEIASWHPAVKNVIPVKLRQWRNKPLKTLFSDEWKSFRNQIKTTRYDAVIDAQGLLKSAFLVPMTEGPSYGLDKHSARESQAAWFYDHKLSVPKNQHAVERIRQLLAKSLGYDLPDTPGHYGICGKFQKNSSEPYVVVLHGTTWQSKHYPVLYWQQLINKLAAEGLKVKLLWGNQVERERAENLASSSKHTEVLPKMALSGVAQLLASAIGAISVDTGLGHLAAAVHCPTLSLYTSTKPGLSGTYGDNQVHLRVRRDCSPCMLRRCNQPAHPEIINKERHLISPPCATSIPPEHVWQSLKELIY